MNFEYYNKQFIEVIEKIDNIKTRTTGNIDETLKRKLNDLFAKLLSASIDENIYFSASPSNIFKIELENRILKTESETIDFDIVDYLKNVYSFFDKMLTKDLKKYRNDVYRYIPFLNDKNYNDFKRIISMRLQYIENLLLENGIKIKKEKIVEYFFDTQIIEYKLIYEKITSTQPIQKSNTQKIKNPKENKSLLFNGSPLNLSERFKIANKVSDVSQKINSLNITETDKYQLLSYILGCDITNARKLMNGNYNSNDRDLNSYFNELGLNK